ncbi:MAG: VOC family protein [Actinomycetota bacterium]
MTDRPRLTLSTVVLDCPDAHALGAFYRRLLGWEVERSEDDWIKIVPPAGGTGLSFQTEPYFVRPTWPSQPDEQQMMIHLDIKVDDLETAGAHALAAGAVLAEDQFADDVRVYFDPAGHPFCLWIETPMS